MNEDPSLVLLSEAEDEPQHDIIVLLGTWALLQANYNCAHFKVLMMLAKLMESWIKSVIIKGKVYHGKFPLSPEQVARKGILLWVPLKDFGFKTQHYDRLKCQLEEMTKIAVNIPIENGDTTTYVHFPQLFTIMGYGKNKLLQICLKFDVDVWRTLMALDKGYAKVDLVELSKMRSVFTKKMYLIKNFLFCRGYKDITMQRMAEFIKGDRLAYKHFSELDDHVLLVAKQEMKRLYDKGGINQYLDYTPYTKPDGDRTIHIVFTVIDRQDIAPKGERLEELNSQQIQLKIKLTFNYQVEEKVATSLSKRLRLKDVGELQIWFMHKDYFIARCKKFNKKLNVAGYIVKGLDGFFKDHGC